nr:hypothetical protein [Tanacetum cinerariifolium]
MGACGSTDAIRVRVVSLAPKGAGGVEMVVMVVKAAVVRRSWRAWWCGYCSGSSGDDVVVVMMMTQKPRKPKRKDTQVPQPSGPIKFVADEAVHKELGDSLVRAATTASCLEAEQDSSGPKCQETIGDTTAQTRRVKKLERRNKLRTHKLKRLYKVGLSARLDPSGDEESLGEDASKQERRIDAIDVDDEITPVNDADNEMFDVDDLGGEEVFVAEQEVVSTAATTETITTEEITLAQVLEALKTSKPKDKDKGIMIEEPMKPKKKYQIRLDEEPALNLQAEFDEEERLARERAKKEQEANIALIETWDDIQAKINADHQLAERLQA